VRLLHYELSDRGVLFFRIASDCFDGRAYDELSATAKCKVVPLIRARVKNMVRRGICMGMHLTISSVDFCHCGVNMKASRSM
jgi:hypothetical protein